MTADAKGFLLRAAAQTGSSILQQEL
jgi:ribosomal protein L34